VSNEHITDHTVYRDTLVSLLRDLVVCRVLMTVDPLNDLLLLRYFETVCMVFTASTGDKLTKREAKDIFVRRISAKEKREAYGQ
jgi:hypothetical protein